MISFSFVILIRTIILFFTLKKFVSNEQQRADEYYDEMTKLIDKIIIKRLISLLSVFSERF
jgi:hypothetical protein